jgi:hypothetical protein
MLQAVSYKHILQLVVTAPRYANKPRWKPLKPAAHEYS